MSSETEPSSSIREHKIIIIKYSDNVNGVKASSSFNIHLKVKLFLSFKIKFTDLLDILNNIRLKCIFNN